ncbi:DMT family transporter [Ruegeria atlantica]|uniref:DMT family transporter n=1 Tax=Ruegeria atlantica TaxID=81569 RepID=UPI002494D364|nr:multidrug efflux SMR transporter [Ruegeria atlantica]
MTYHWLILVLAGAFEIGWPIGLKNGSGPNGTNWYWVAFAVGSMAASGFFLFLAQKAIPIGTAYAVWTGIGAAGTFLVGVMFYAEAATVGRMLALTLIVSGVVLFKITS